MENEEKQAIMQKKQNNRIFEINQNYLRTFFSHHNEVLKFKKLMRTDIMLRIVSV